MGLAKSWWEKKKLKLLTVENWLKIINQSVESFNEKIRQDFPDITQA